MTLDRWLPLLGLCVYAPHVVAQGIAPVRLLPEAFREHAVPFSTIGSVVVLSDGSALVSDVRDAVVKRIDFANGAERQVGRTGSGPGEYRVPTGLVSLPADSVWITDFGNGRWLSMHASGAFGQPVSMAAAPSALRTSAVNGVDAKGRLYLATDDGDSERAGSSGVAVVLRIDRTTWRAESIGVLATPKGRIVYSKNESGNRRRTVNNRPLWGQDVFAVAPNGDVALLRSSDYHVDWVRADGRRVTSAPVAYQPITIDDAEKRAYLQTTIRAGGIIIMRSDGVQQPRKAVQKTPPFDFRASDVNQFPWPKALAPFSSAFFAPDGRLWVQRNMAQSAPYREYDVLDTEGRRVETWHMPKDQHIVAMRPDGLFVARTDEDGQLFLRRYQLPARNAATKRAR